MKRRYRIPQKHHLVKPEPQLRLILQTKKKQTSDPNDVSDWDDSNMRSKEYVLKRTTKRKLINVHGERKKAAADSLP